MLVRQKRLAEANALARPRRVATFGCSSSARSPSTRRRTSAPRSSLLDEATLAETEPEELASSRPRRAPRSGAPADAAREAARTTSTLVPNLYNTSFSVERPQALAILRKVLSLAGAAAAMAGEARTALVMAWNNACIHAHALGDYRLAVELADGGQKFGARESYIYHSAACAYAAVGQIDRALEQVAQAIEHEYEHTEKMETDADLSPLQSDPRFAALFNEWRTRRADLN